MAPHQAAQAAQAPNLQINGEMVGRDGRARGVLVDMNHISGYTNLFSSIFCAGTGRFRSVVGRCLTDELKHTSRSRSRIEKNVGSYRPVCFYMYRYKVFLSSSSDLVSSNFFCNNQSLPVHVHVF